MAARTLPNASPSLDQDVWNVLMRGIKGKVEFRREATRQMQATWAPHASVHMGRGIQGLGNIGGNTLLTRGDGMGFSQRSIPRTHVPLTMQGGALKMEGGALSAAQGQEIVQKRLGRLQAEKQARAAALQTDLGQAGEPGARIPGQSDLEGAPQNGASTAAAPVVRGIGRKGKLLKPPGDVAPFGVSINANEAVRMELNSMFQEIEEDQPAKAALRAHKLYGSLFANGANLTTEQLEQLSNDLGPVSEGMAKVPRYADYAGPLKSAQEAVLAQLEMARRRVPVAVRKQTMQNWMAQNAPRGPGVSGIASNGRVVSTLDKYAATDTSMRDEEGKVIPPIASTTTAATTTASTRVPDRGSAPAGGVAGSSGAAPTGEGPIISAERGKEFLDNILARNEKLLEEEHSVFPGDVIQQHAGRNDLPPDWDTNDQHGESAQNVTKFRQGRSQLEAELADYNKFYHGGPAKLPDWHDRDMRNDVYGRIQSNALERDDADSAPQTVFGPTLETRELLAREKAKEAAAAAEGVPDTLEAQLAAEAEAAAAAAAGADAPPPAVRPITFEEIGRAQQEDIKATKAKLKARIAQYEAFRRAMQTSKGAGPAAAHPPPTLPKPYTMEQLEAWKQQVDAYIRALDSMEIVPKQARRRSGNDGLLVDAKDAEDLPAADEVKQSGAKRVQLLPPAELEELSKAGEAYAFHNRSLPAASRYHDHLPTQVKVRLQAYSGPSPAHDPALLTDAGYRELRQNYDRAIDDLETKVKEAGEYSRDGKLALDKIKLLDELMDGIKSARTAGRRSLLLTTTGEKQDKQRRAMADGDVAFGSGFEHGRGRRVSGKGIKKLRGGAVLPGYTADNSFWDPTQGKYVPLPGQGPDMMGMDPEGMGEEQPEEGAEPVNYVELLASEYHPTWALHPEDAEEEDQEDWSAAFDVGDSEYQAVRPPLPKPVPRPPPVAPPPAVRVPGPGIGRLPAGPTRYV